MSLIKLCHNHNRPQIDIWHYEEETRNTDSHNTVKVKQPALFTLEIYYNQVPHLTQATTWERDKNTNKHNEQEPRGQPFPSRWPQGSNEQMRKHDKHAILITQMIHKRSTALDRSVKYYLEGLNRFHIYTYQIYILWWGIENCSELSDSLSSRKPLVTTLYRWAGRHVTVPA